MLTFHFLYCIFNIHRGDRDITGYAAIPMIMIDYTMIMHNHVLKFARKEMVKPLENMSTVKDKRIGASSDHALLFQSLLMIATNSNEIDLVEILSY